MNKNKLKTYAQGARREFIASVRERAHYCGVSESGIDTCEVKGDFAIIKGSAFPKTVAVQRRRLEEQVERKGFAQTMDEVAYTWFNRFAAIRYMELHGFLTHGYRVLSHPAGSPLPEILEKAQYVTYAGLDKDEVVALKMDGTRDEELYRILLIAECNELSKAMPFLFERVRDYTELLLPDNLLHTDSLVRKLAGGVDEEDWQEVEIIGWIYQFYISEKKDEVVGMGKVVRSEDIPAATQLFTPNWIVKYLVQNSLGAQWMRTYPESSLKSKMEYYIEPAEQTDEVVAKIKAHTPATLSPEELTLLDPACGSGHILVEAYDTLKEIYLERGYRKRDIPGLILTKNLYGLEIDDRAAQLAGFAVMMKARGDDRGIFDKRTRPNIVSIQDSKDISVQDEFCDLMNLFRHAKTYGTLIRVPEELSDKLPDIRKELERKREDIDNYELWTDKQYYEGLLGLVTQAEALSRRYDAVVANPPYMGGKGMNADLKKFAKQKYPDTKSDLFAMFIERILELTLAGGFSGLMSPFTWMFLGSYEKIREKILSNHSLSTLIRPEYHAFYHSAHVPICGFTICSGALNIKGSFIDLSAFYGSDIQSVKTLEAIRNPNCGWFYTSSSNDFKKIPGSPIAYWVSDKTRAVFGQSISLGDIAKPLKGFDTGGEGEKYFRFWYEVSEQKTYRKGKMLDRSSWVEVNKGGAFKKWYGNRENIVFFKNKGKILYEKKGANIRNKHFYFKQGITYSVISSSSISFRLAFPEAVFYQHGATCIIEQKKVQLYIISLLNSNVTNYLLQILCPTLSYTVDDVGKLPIKRNVEISLLNIERIMILAQTDWESFETSWNFKVFPMLSEGLNRNTVDASFFYWKDLCTHNIMKMKQLEEENNMLFIDAYGLHDELTPDILEDQITLARADKEDDTKRLISYSVGCMMGRYSLDVQGLIYAHAGNEGFDPDKYQTFPADDDGIIPITDNEWFEDDAACRFFRFIETAWCKETLEENLEFAADAIDRKTAESSRDSIRRYFLNGFFKDHLKTYRKRPIYWLFTSGKEKAFQALVYLHRYNEGTLSRMRTEYVLPLQSKMTTRMEHLEQDKEHASSTSAANKIQKMIGKMRKQKDELLKYDEKLRHYADMKIKLDLDDGVKVNYGKFGDLLAEVKAVTGKK